MKTLKVALLSLALPALTFSISSYAAMHPTMESALIEVCKAAKSNNPLKLKKTTKSHNIKTKTVALKLICNDQDIISFAQHHGADKTAARLQKSISKESATAIAALSKFKVSFIE